MRLLALIVLLAQEGLPQPPPRMPIDDEATAFACTFESALRADRCTYEARRGPGDARENSRLAAQAGARECTLAAMGDEDVRKECERAIAEISLAGKCALAARLSDPNGHLSPDAAGCIGAMGAVLRHAFFSAAVSRECCSCLAESRGGVPSAQCKREIGSLSPGSALSGCIAKSSCSACSFSSETKAPAPPTAPPPPAGNPVHPTRI